MPEIWCCRIRSIPVAKIRKFVTKRVFYLQIELCEGSQLNGSAVMGGAANPIIWADVPILVYGGRHPLHEQYYHAHELGVPIMKPGLG